MIFVWRPERQIRALDAEIPSAEPDQEWERR